MKRTATVMLVFVLLFGSQLLPIVVKATQLSEVSSEAEASEGYMANIDDEFTQEDGTLEDLSPASDASSGTETEHEQSEENSLAVEEVIPQESASSDSVLQNEAPTRLNNIIASGVSGSANWVIYDDGLLEVYGGELDIVNPWTSYKDQITSVLIKNVKASLSLSGFFSQYTNLKTVEFVNFDTSGVVDMNFMFSGCEALTSIDLSSLNTSNVLYMIGVFNNCKSIVNLDLTTFNTSNVLHMAEMFAGCSALKNLAIASFDTSNVENMEYMFNGCSSIEELDLSSFDTSKVNNMMGMFYDCGSLKALDLSMFDTSSVTTMFVMFSGCSALSTLDVSSFDTGNVTTMQGMFTFCVSLTVLNVSSFDTSNVTNMNTMFFHCEELVALELGSFNTSNVTDMSQMFVSCSSLKDLDLSSFNTSKVTTMQGMFESCSSLEELDVTSFDTKNVIRMDRMFSECRSLEELDVGHFNTSNVTMMNSMFGTCVSLKKLDLSHFNTKNVTTMSNMFSYNLALENLNISSFDTSNVTEMSAMFFGCETLTELDVSHFDTSSVDNMFLMFYKCSSLKELDVSHFDTSNVVNLYGMFGYCSSLEAIDVSRFDVGNVFGDYSGLSSLFEGCTSLKSLDLSSFDTSHFKKGARFRMLDSAPNIVEIVLNEHFIFDYYELALYDISTDFVWLDENETVIKTTFDLETYHNNYGKENTYRVAKPIPVKYVDEAGNEIASSKTTYAYLIDGGNYDATTSEYKIAVAGYQLDESKLPSNGKGSIEAGEQVVTYVYKKSAPLQAYVTVKYVDQIGNEIALPKSITGNLDDHYDASTAEYKLTIAGYQLDESKLPTNAQGFFSDNSQTIIYVYQQIELPITSQVNEENQLAENQAVKGRKLPNTGENSFNSVTSIILGSLLLVFSGVIACNQKKALK